MDGESLPSDEQKGQANMGTVHFKVRDRETGEILRTARTYSGGGGYGILIDQVEAAETHWDNRKGTWTNVIAPEQRISYWDYDYEPDEMAGEMLGRPVELIAEYETDESGRITRRFDEDGFDAGGQDWQGYDRNGINDYGHEKWDEDYEIVTNRFGETVRHYESDIDEHGFYPDGEHVNGTAYDDEGYNCEGFNREGRDREGFSRMGYGPDGFNRNGVNIYGVDRDGFLRTNRYGGEGYEDLEPGMNIHTGTYYDPDGFDEYGFAEDGHHRDGSKHFFDAANEIQRKLDAMDPMDDEYGYWTEKRRDLAEEGQRWKRVETASKTAESRTSRGGYDPLADTETFWSSDNGFGGSGGESETIAVRDDGGTWKKIGDGLRGIGNTIGVVARSAKRAMDDMPKTGDIEVSGYTYTRNGKQVRVDGYTRKRSKR